MDGAHLSVRAESAFWRTPTAGPRSERRRPKGGRSHMHGRRFKST